MNEQPDEKKGQPLPASRRRSCTGCLGRGAVGLLVFLVGAMLAGAIYQAAANASDLKKYPPPGKLYDVGGYRLHLYCIGEGSPTVILEAGAGSPALIWDSVQKGTANSTRVCSYDRAGFGWSEPAGHPLSPDQVAQNLHVLLEAANVPGPYVLVGHSAGGVYVRAYASQYPSQVVGMVLVDSSHEGQNASFPPEYVKLDDLQKNMAAFCQFVSPFGLIRLGHTWDMLTSGYSMDAGVGKAMLATMYRTSYCRAMGAELKALSASLNQPDIPGSLGDLPLVVLTADTTEAELRSQIPAYLQSSIGPEGISKIYEVSRELQQDLVGLSSRGRQIMVKQSGHNIQLDQPGVVVDAIQQVLEQVRGE
jgi:pimeloyl-ACP methyl ester carboxylesterase